jgi:hypothetical protein
VINFVADMAFDSQVLLVGLEENVVTNVHEFIVIVRKLFEHLKKVAPSYKEQLSEVMAFEGRNAWLSSEKGDFPEGTSCFYSFNDIAVF